ncbi:MAG: InlB B-repeat-containing protein [Bacteroidales bacterium]|jgi:uncharacterized repeat protein (TIGR02543 family)|nr:InlB B-repeat-containing protein [Bacteroidales bacterium]
MLRKKNFLVVTILILLVFLVTGCTLLTEVKPQTTPPESLPAGYTVTFVSNGGSEVEPIKNVEHGQTINVPTAPTKDGFNFDGWYKEQTLDNRWDFSTDTIIADITLYAKWDTLAPVIASYTTGKRDTVGTKTLITVPEGTQKGDLMVLIFSLYKDDNSPITPLGWWRLKYVEYYKKHLIQAVYCRKLNEELSDFTVYHHGDRDALTSWILLRIPGGDMPELSVSFADADLFPQSKPLTHSFGAGTDVLWISTVCWTSTHTVGDWPSNLPDNHISIITPEMSGVSIAIATSTTKAESLNPDNFTLTGPGAYRDPDWTAFTLAIKK